MLRKMTLKTERREVGEGGGGGVGGMEAIIAQLATSLPAAQWIEHPNGVRKVLRSIPVGASIGFFFVPRSLSMHIYFTDSRVGLP